MSTSVTLLPPEDFEVMADLGSFLDQVTDHAVLLGPDGQQVPLPKEVFDVLVNVVDAMHEGLAITVAPMEQRLTTQQAADFLGISRPTLVRLLDNGDLEHEKLPGSRHRKVRLRDLLAFEAQLRQKRKTALDELAQDAQDHGLLDLSANDYAAALRAARSEK